ncbi:MAG: tetratricopeptide repeat protein [Saprospiraceae bacterium]|nr:tetratricopeptide repeat protein [Saprospiraceae bacterium]MCB9318798.1 tetratricopeptide repeat protein [Lewinellaceae bacterium]
MPANRDHELVTVIFTDIQGYSALTQQDESRAVDMVTHYQRIIADCTLAHHGELIQFYGDGSLSIHHSTLDAIHCAIAMQTSFRNNPTIPVRIGIHLGEIVRQDQNVFGDAVNIASRLQNLSVPGSILVSQPVAQQFLNYPEIKLKFLCTERVKNITAPIQIYAVEHEDLIVPSPNEIHRRNPIYKRPYLLVVSILFLGLLAVFLTDQFIDARRNRIMYENNIVVIPFTNNTRDTSLSYIGAWAGDMITQSLEETESVKVVSYRSLATTKTFEEMGLISPLKQIRTLKAQLAIKGNYYLLADSSFQFTSSLVNLQNNEVLIHFPIIQRRWKDLSDGILELSQRIAGYWESKGQRVLVIPRQDAHRAYMEAMRYLAKDYEKAEQALLKAIQLDSTYLDAYLLLTDIHISLNNPHHSAIADSILQQIGKRFETSSFSTKQDRMFRLYQAIVEGENENAYHILEEDYRLNPEDLFINTSMAVVALQFVNEPLRTLEILSEISPDTLDFESNYFARDRISYAIQANCQLGRFNDALRYASYYPADDEDDVHLGLRTRALVMAQDTPGINTLLQDVKLTRDQDSYARVLYTVSQEYKKLGDATKFRYYASLALNEYRSLQGYYYAQVLLDLDSSAVAMDYIKPIYESYPNIATLIFSMARCYLQQGDTAQARLLIQKLQENKPEKYDYGQSYYYQCLIYVLLGEYENAQLKLRQSINDGFYFHSAVVDNDPLLKPLFNLPGYEDITHPLRN